MILSCEIHSIFNIPEPFFADHFDVQLGVLEGFSQHTALPLNRDDAVVDRTSDIVGNLQLQARVNRLHLEMLGIFLQLETNFK